MPSPTSSRSASGTRSKPRWSRRSTCGPPSPPWRAGTPTRGSSTPPMPRSRRRYGSRCGFPESRVRPSSIRSRPSSARPSPRREPWCAFSPPQRRRRPTRGTASSSSPPSSCADRGGAGGRRIHAPHRRAGDGPHPRSRDSRRARSRTLSRPREGHPRAVLAAAAGPPPTAVGMVLLSLLARRGPVGRWLESAGIEIVFTWKAVLLATMVMAFPLLVRSARTGFEEVDPRLIGLARTLGCGPLAAFFRVTLPLAWRGILAGTVLAFARALGEFGATIMIAGNIPGRTQTLALAIFQASQVGRDDRARVLAGVTVLLAFATLWTAELFARRQARRAAT